MKLIHRFLLTGGALLVFALLALPTGSAMAVTYTVTKTADTNDGTCNADCSLREAVQSSWYNTPGEYDTINVPAGTYLLELGQLEILDDTAIIGAGSGTTIIDGVTNYRAFLVYSGYEFYLSGVTITNGTQDVGGGIYNSGNTYLENSVVSGNSAIFGNGGGIYSDGYLNINNTVISGNTASQFGGGVYSNYNGTDIYGNSTVSGNTALYGGGIFIDYTGATLNMSETTVSGNTATEGHGGGILTEGTTSITDSTISDNSSPYPGGGGGGMLSSASTTITNSTFSNNSAELSGGGFYNWYDSATITGSTFSNNSAKFGGGIFVEVEDTVSLDQSTITGNTAWDSGGGVLNAGTMNVTASSLTSNGGYNVGGGIGNWGTVNVTNSTLTGNYAGKGGGISGVAGSTVNISGSTISSNTGGIQGGGIHLVDSDSTLSGSTVANNSIQSGSTVYDGTGAGIYYEGGTHTVNTSVIANNVAKRAGGGMYIQDASVTVTDTNINSNDGYQSGGGIIIVSYGPPANLDIVRSSIFANSSGFVGGGLENDLGTVTVSNSTISGNATSSYGGGIINNSGTVTLTNSTLYGNSATTGGGIYRWPGGGGGYNYVYLRNTIVANSPGGDCGGSALFTNGYNLTSDGTCAFAGGGIGDISNAWPALGPLANNGGPTPTHALLEGSPAADGGGPGCPSIDQRGVGRPQGLRCDIGAYEAPDTDGDGSSDPADSNDDNDGLIDGYDTCPLVAEDYDAFEDANGCPEPDNDGDGICDSGQTSLACSGADSGKQCFDPAATLSCPTIDCRNLGEDADAFKDGDGCPEPDNDNDGHIDSTDNCPGTDSLAGANGMLGSPQDLNHNGIRDGAEATLTSDDSTLTFEDYDGVLDADGCHDSPGDDFDQDGLSDDTEVFGRFTDPGNPDTDVDTVIDGSDNCPLWPNTAQALPNWPIPASDSDCDGFPNGVAVGLLAPETYIGTDPTKQCAATSTANDEPNNTDAWPMDYNDNRLANGQDFLTFIYSFAQPINGPAITVPGMGTFEPERWDFTGNGIINGQDFLKYINFFAKSCSLAGS